MARSGPIRGGARAAILSACLAGLLAACAPVVTPIVRNHGYTPDDATLSLIEVGVDDRESVIEKVGRPVSTGVMEGSDFYYVSSQRSTLGFLAPDEVDREVVSISFGEGGRVANVERFGLEQGRVVALSRRVTETNIRGIGFIQQLLNSVGRLRAEDIVDG